MGKPLDIDHKHGSGKWQICEHGPAVEEDDCADLKHAARNVRRRQTFLRLLGFAIRVNRPLANGMQAIAAVKAPA